MNSVAPQFVLASLAAAFPESARPHVIIVGSLAAGWHYFTERNGDGIRTKDVDCMFCPHASAVVAARDVAEQLVAAGWEFRQTDLQPGNASTDESLLPFVRLHPPSTHGAIADDWFLELVGAHDPKSKAPKSLHRLPLKHGQYALYSFRYLSLTEWSPATTPFGFCVALPAMMALANLLHHPCIAPDLIRDSGGDKRSNKDLGRVLALAALALEQDIARGTGEFALWPQQMAQALRARFPDEASVLAAQAGTGLRELLDTPGDLQQALEITNRGLLAFRKANLPAFQATGRRFVQVVLEPLQGSF